MVHLQLFLMKKTVGMEKMLAKQMKLQNLLPRHLEMSLNQVNLQEASFSSINALIDSVKYSEASECMPVGDDAGMNLLASVATGDFSNSNVASPIDSPQRNTAGMNLLASVATGDFSNSNVASPVDSPQRNTPLVEHSSMGNDTKLKPPFGDEVVQNQNQSVEGADDDHLKQDVAAGNSWAKDADNKTGSAMEKFGELNEHLTSSSMALPEIVDQCLENGKLKEIIATALVNMPSAHAMENASDIGDSKEHMEKESGGVDDECSVDAKQKVSTSVVNEEVIDLVVKVEKEVIEGSSSVPSIELYDDNNKNITEGLESGLQAHQMSVFIGNSINGTDKEALPSCPTKDMILENVDEAKPEKDVEIDAPCHASHSEKQKPKLEIVTAQEGEQMQENLEYREASPGTEQPKRTRGSKVTGVEADEAEECTSITTETPHTGVAATDAKVEFDLNEDFNAEEGKSMEPNNLTAVGCSAPVQLISSLIFPVSSVSSSLPASITVAAAAKGPFVPPHDLLRTKGALGWKGSAATSAFRPAERRKSLDMPLGTSNTSIPDATSGKQSRPPLDIDLNVPDERVLENLAFRSSTHVTDSAPDLSNNHD
ncbi:hypothetical protein V6N12_005323 [Hibiscus sabdariffa]|uniref:Uncharacterized protein n=1 Tax=Hibiscus sabdariffa TaxID=183260 RepID=A0ABR2CP38_9ROSI